MANKITVSEQKIGNLKIGYDENDMIEITDSSSKSVVRVASETLKIILDTIRQNSKSNGVVQQEKEKV